MPRRLHRYYGSGPYHFITTNCFHQRPLPGTAARRNLFLAILEQVRLRYGLVVVGYVIMPEHIHLLISEPDRGTPSTVMQVVKQRFARRVLRELRRKERPRTKPSLAGEPRRRPCLAAPLLRLRGLFGR
jgi:putative transposase